MMYVYYGIILVQSVVLTKKVFLNITLGEALEEQKNGDKLNIGTIVSIFHVYVGHLVVKIEKILTNIGHKRKFYRFHGSKYTIILKQSKK